MPPRLLRQTTVALSVFDVSWSVPRGWRTDNPCLLIPKLKGGEGYEPWPWEMIELAREHLRSDLWRGAALALYTGQRMGDALGMRWDHVSGNIVTVAQEKTRKRVAVPLHEDLRKILAEVPKTAVTILTSTAGTPWTKDGFKTSWQKAFAAPAKAGAPWPLKPIRDAGLVFHGLQEERCGLSAGGGLLRCGGRSDYGAVAPDGRALRSAGQSAQACCVRDPQVGTLWEREFAKRIAKPARSQMTRGKQGIETIGDPGRIRTCDPLLRRQML